MSDPLIQALMGAPDSASTDAVWRLGTVTQVSPLLVKVGAATTGQPCRNAIADVIAVNDFVVVLLNGPDRIAISRVSPSGSVAWNSKVLFGGSATNVTSNGRYRYLNAKTIEVQVGWKCTGAPTAGSLTVLLPVNASYPEIQATQAGCGVFIGPGYLQKNGGYGYPVMMLTTDGNNQASANAQGVVTYVAHTSGVTNAAPFAQANLDYGSAVFVYTCV